MSRRRMPSLNWLRVFEAAARSESFARAAEQLNMSAPAVSQQIRALEGHLGKPLFERRAQQVLLTEAGRAFLPVVRQSLAAVETTAATLFGENAAQTVTLQAVTILAMGWLPAQLAAFEADHPEIAVTVTTGNLLADFRTVLPGREPDLQIAFGAATDFPGSAEALFRDNLQAVATPEVAASIKAPQDLIHHSLLEVATHRAGWHQVLQHQDAIAVAQARIQMVDHTPHALMIAAQGLGVALARAPASDAMVSALGLVPVRGIPQVAGQQRYWLIQPEARAKTRATETLKNWLMDRVKTQIGS